MFPKFGEKLMVMIEQGGTAERASNTANMTIDNIIITVVIFHYKPNSSRRNS